jgi:kelch-like protein 9/13
LVPFGLLIPLPVANQWTLCQRSLNIREAGVCVIDQKIYIVGGINGEHYLSTLIQLYDPLRDEIGIVESFTTRIYGRSCAVLVLPDIMSIDWPQGNIFQ